MSNLFNVHRYNYVKIPLTRKCSTLHSQSASKDYNCCDGLLAVCLVLILIKHKSCARPTQPTGSSVHEVTNFYLN